MGFNRPAQSSFNFDALVQAVAREAARAVGHTYAPRDVMTLPDDYGETTDWTPRATPFEIEWFEAPERAWNVGLAA